MAKWYSKFAKKYPLIIILGGILFVSCGALVTWRIPNFINIYDRYLEKVTQQETDRIIAESGSGLVEAIEKVNQDQEQVDSKPGGEIIDTGADLGETISEDDPGAALDDTTDTKEPDDGEPGAAPSDGSATEPEPEPDPEAVDDLFWFEHFAQGVALKAYQYNSVGDTTRGVTNANPYVFVKVSSCGMRVDIRTMPTAAFPGMTAKEALTAIFQTDYVDKAPSDESYEIITEPYDLEINGAPAARLEAWHTTSKYIYLFQLTTIRGETRSGIVKGQMLESCAERPDSVAYLNEMTDSVELFEPHPVCYVGHLPDSDPAKYNVGCDNLEYGFVGIDALADEGFIEIVKGPVIWDECAIFMRENDQENW
ncbi:MAG: hypothetical protein E4H27_02895 [Anaerolineales bacterium]|nr:MAG: hypothetical protein E4H27_02895 [Anaerolineales bacterium]